MSYSLLDNLDAVDEDIKDDHARLPIVRVKSGQLRRFRVLPPSPAWAKFFEERKIDPIPFLFHWVHAYEETPGSGRWKIYNCPRRNKGPKRDCDGCERFFVLRDSDGAADQEAAKDYNAKRKVSMVVIDRQEEEKGPQLLSISAPWTDDPEKRKKSPPTQWEKFEKLFRVKKKDLADPTAKGWDFTMLKTGEALGTSYDFDVADEPTPLHADQAQADAWINNQPDLPAFVSVLSESELNAKLGLREDPKITQGRRQLPPSSDPTANDIIEGEMMGDDDWD